MNYKDLKQSDVIVLANYWDGIVIVNKIDDSIPHCSPQLYTYVALEEDRLMFEKDIPQLIHFIENDTIRYATDEEKIKLYNAIGKHFTEEYDKDWYNHFTDSSWFDIQDYLFDMFNIKPDENRVIHYPAIIDEIQGHIWDGCCKATGNYEACTDYVESEMVNKQEFIEKSVNYFTPILKTYCSEECVKELITGFVNSIKEE